MRTIKQYRKKSRKECALLSIYKHLTAGECYSYEATLRIIRKHIKN